MKEYEKKIMHLIKSDYYKLPVYEVIYWDDENGTVDIANEHNELVVSQGSVIPIDTYTNVVLADDLYNCGIELAEKILEVYYEEL